MTGHRKSCKTCKKVAANSLPFVETSVPVVDGFLYQNNDHDENPTPGFSPRVTDAISDPATAGTAAAYATLDRTEPTPGLRKTAQRKAATQASSFTVVAHQTTPQTGAAADKDNDGPSDKDAMSKASDPIRRGEEAAASSGNSACGDKSDPKGAAGCSDQHASKDKVAASVASKTSVATIMTKDIHESVMEVFSCEPFRDLGYYRSVAMYPVNFKENGAKDNFEDLWQLIVDFYKTDSDKSSKSNKIGDGEVSSGKGMKDMKHFVLYFIENYKHHTGINDDHFGLKINKTSAGTWEHHVPKALKTKKGELFGKTSIPESLQDWVGREKLVVNLLRYIDEIALQDCLKESGKDLNDKLHGKDYLLCLGQVRSIPTSKDPSPSKNDYYTRPRTLKTIVSPKLKDKYKCDFLVLNDDQTYYARHVISDYAWGTDCTVVSEGQQNGLTDDPCKEL